MGVASTKQEADPGNPEKDKLHIHRKTMLGEITGSAVDLSCFPYKGFQKKK